MYINSSVAPTYGLPASLWCRTRCLKASLSDCCCHRPLRQLKPLAPHPSIWHSLDWGGVGTWCNQCVIVSLLRQTMSVRQIVCIYIWKKFPRRSLSWIGIVTNYVTKQTWLNPSSDNDPTWWFHVNIVYTLKRLDQNSSIFFITEWLLQHHLIYHPCWCIRPQFNLLYKATNI